MAEYLGDLSLQDLDVGDQRKIGLALARRWTVNGTFMPLTDVIEPILNGEADYPPAFIEGVVEGLLLDHNGYLRTSADDIERAVGVGWRVNAQRRARLFEELADRIAEARPSHAFDNEAQGLAVGVLRRLAGERRNSIIRRALERIASRLAAIRQDADADD